jgi:FkbM family methyltransferase
MTSTHAVPAVAADMVAHKIKDLVRRGSRAIGRRYVPPEELAYQRLKAKGFIPASIIDVGAYRGDWTRLVRRVFPDVPVVMVEPQASKRPDLEKVCRELSDVRYVPVLLGRNSGDEVSFFEMETGSSMFPENSNVPRQSKTLTTTTLDDIAGSISVPALLKIDVQGAELEVLEGARQTLSTCEVIQLEVAFLPYNEGAPDVLNVLNYMTERGFVPFDISGFSRPNGVDLAQIDMLFTRSASPLRSRFFNF